MQRCMPNYDTYPMYTTLISGVNIPQAYHYQSTVVEAMRTHLKKETPLSIMKAESVQTMYRELETQTDPYTPDIQEPYDRSLEILTLGWLSWNNGLPAGMREAVIIERARQRRAWERAIPVPFNGITVEIRNMIIEAIELNEWTSREVELAALNSVRMDLAERCMKENLATNRMKFESRLLRYINTKTEEKEMKLEEVRMKLSRSIRKLMYERNNISRRYRKWNIVEELQDKTSELYGPQARFGFHPRRGLENIPFDLRFWNVFTRMEIIKLNANEIGDIKKPLAFDYEKKSKPTKTYKTICHRETRWTGLYLDKLHSLLKALRLQSLKSMNKDCKLKQLIPVSKESFSTPAVTGISQEEETLYQSCLYLQRTIKGRAIQTVMFEGRVRCQELLDELKSTDALLDHINDIRNQERKKMYLQQREEEIKAMENKRRAEILLSLEGKTVSEVLDHLSKELLRLEDERATHAAALLADKERHRREAEEAGRRQAEEQRRRESDEMHKQISKVYQNSVDLLEDEYASRLKDALASKHARMKAEEYARRIDQAAHEAQIRGDELEEEEIVSDLVHNFALPEAEKEIVRKRLKDRQRSMLTTCHDEIYSQIEKAVLSKRSPAGVLLPLPRPPKHRIPPVFHIKFLKLARTSASDSSFDISNDNSRNLLTPDDQEWQSLRQLDKIFEMSENINHPENENRDNWSSGFSRQEVIIN